MRSQLPLSLLYKRRKGLLGGFSNFFVAFVQQYSAHVIQKEGEKISKFLRPLLHLFVHIGAHLAKSLYLGDCVPLLHSFENLEYILIEIHHSRGATAYFPRCFSCLRCILGTIWLLATLLQGYVHEFVLGLHVEFGELTKNVDARVEHRPRERLLKFFCSTLHFHAHLLEIFPFFDHFFYVH